MAVIGYSLLTVVAIILEMPKVAIIAVVVCAINAVAISYHNFRLGWVLYHVLKIVAKKLRLLPIHATSTKPAAPSAILQS
jgi:hypothetical protein